MPSKTKPQTKPTTPLPVPNERQIVPLKMIPVAAVQSKLSAMQQSLERHQHELSHIEKRRMELLEQIDRHVGSIATLNDLIVSFAPQSNNEGD